MDERRQAELERELARLTKINGVLMERVERNMDIQGNDAFSLFQAAIVLESKVRERTAELEQAMSDLKRSNQQLTTAKEAADSANRAKSEFLANMSHEIRTPMNGVLGMTELLLGMSLTEQQARLANTVQRSARSLLAIINDILDFSKIEAGKLELECIEFDPREVVEDTIELLAPRARAKGLELVGQFSYAIEPRLRGDPGRLRQILTNLIANAVKFTSQGHVLVRAEVVLSQNDFTLLRFEVTDTGIGIAPGVEGKLFRSFSQADGSMSRKYGGTGLGLAIAKQLALLMGGEIGIDPVVDGGSQFWFTARFARATRAATPPLVLAGAGKSVLVVDPHPLARRVLAEQLSELGARVAVADSAAAALSHLDQAAASGSKFDIAMVASPLPGEGTVVREAIAQGAHVVAMADVDTPDRSHDLGCVWIQAPVRCSQLIGVLSGPQHGMHASSAGERSQPLILDGGDGLGPRVLVAEDNSINQDVAREMLEQTGCRVEIVSDGRSCVEALDREVFDLVLMDCQMPEMDGFEATREARRREKSVGRARVPIVALTANALSGDRERCLASGMDDFLSKPFSRDELRLVIARWTNIAPAAGRESEPAGAPAAPQSEMGTALDPAALGRLFAMRRPGREDIVARVIRLYLTESTAQVAALKAAAADHDWNTASGVAHSLRSTTASVGAIALSHEFARIESAARRRSDDIHEALPAVCLAHERVCEELARVLDTAVREVAPQ
ncbi:MAG: response regulator [bacterium]